jgi:hypothetical protein
MNSWGFEPLNSGFMYTLPPGEYYIGDIFHALESDIYKNIYCMNGERPGLYKNGNNVFLVGDSNNGFYIGTDEFEYEVNTGGFGIVSVSLLESEPACGMIYDFSDGITAIIDTGKYTFESVDFYLNIDTSEPYDSDFNPISGSEPESEAEAEPKLEYKDTPIYMVVD